ncbi:MAG: metallophosphoesterase family protein [Anaerolineae bacterium]
MKFAIISDIHGNLVALEAVLAELKADAPVQIVCLGDVSVTGPQPRQSLAKVRELGCPVVMGNTDEWILAPTPFTIRSEDDQILYDLERWAAEQMTEADLAFIRTFQPTIELDLGDGRTLLCCHGSPRNNREIIRATTPDEELAEILGEHRVAIIAGGHTHTPMLRRLGNSFILNSGSVGLPMWREDGVVKNPAWAEYALVEVANGRLNIALRRAPYPLDDLRAAIQNSVMPHAVRFLADWIPGGGA